MEEEAIIAGGMEAIVTPRVVPSMHAPSVESRNEGQDEMKNDDIPVGTSRR